MPVIRTSLEDRIITDCRAMGIVGMVNLLLAVYMIGTSRLLDHPLSAIVRGASSSGKSFAVNQVAQLFPADQVIMATRMTPQALYHMGSVAHKFVVAGERSRVQDDSVADATAALRQLQSERRITKQITERAGEGGFSTREIVVEGPIAYVETTTLAPGRVFPEDMNRALLLETDESEEQTRAILTHQGKRCAQPQSPEDAQAIITRHRNFQAKLERRAVHVPFAEQLMDLIPAKRVEARRAGQQVLSMIEAVALLHQLDRAPDEQGRIVATRSDYETAVRLLRQPLSASLGVSASAAAFYRKLAGRFKQNAFSTANAQQLDLVMSDRTIRAWLAELAEQECVELVRPAIGPKPAWWKMNGKTPEAGVLPAPARLFAGKPEMPATGPVASKNAGNTGGKR